MARVSEGALDDPAVRSRDEVRSVKDLLEFWTGHQEEREEAGRITARTLEIYRQVGRRICKEPLARSAVYELRTTNLERYVNRRLADGGAPSSVKLEMTVLKAAWDWGQQHDLVPQRRLQKPEIKVTRPKSYTPTRAEWERVLSHVPAGWAHDVLELQGLLGCRIGGVASMRCGDVDFERERVTIRNKGKVRTVPLSPGALTVLKRWVDDDAPADRRVFVLVADRTIRSAIGHEYLKPACVAAKVPAFTPHGLRRMVERELAVAGVPIQTFAAILGHSPQVALAAYSAVRDEDMKAAFDQAGIGGS